MSITTAYSQKELPEAVADLRRQCGPREPSVALVFTSPKYNPMALSRQMREAFPQTCVAGCTTAGEIVGGKMLSGSVVAMFLDEDIVEDAASAVVEKLSSGIGLDAAFSELERHFKTPVSELDVQKFVGLVLIDGLSGAEERLMEELGDRANLVFVGGSAGDDLRFERTQVLHDGTSFTNAAVLLILKLKRGFDILKTQSFESTGRSLLATRVDELGRTVMEFNHQPALDAYAEALGVAVEEAPAMFFRRPLGLMVHGEPFVRSPQSVDGSSIVFYCQIRQGMELDVLRATSIVQQTSAAFDAKRAALGEIRGLIDFQCILRTLKLRGEHRCDQYGEIFRGIPMIGLSTYGEAYLGHMNQTSTIFMFR